VNGDNSLKTLGSLYWNLATGGFLNKNSLSIPDLNHINGNQIILAAPYLNSFQLAPYYAFSNDADHYWEAHTEWRMQGFLSNKIPLFKRLKWYLILGGNALYASPDLNYSEAFIGIDHIGFDKMRFFRIDFIHSWSRFLPYSSGIRIGIAPNGLIKINSNSSKGEW